MAGVNTGVYWIGANGHTYVNQNGVVTDRGATGVPLEAAGGGGGGGGWGDEPSADATIYKLNRIDDPNPPKKVLGANYGAVTSPASDTAAGTGGYTSAPKVLDTAGLASLDSLMGKLDVDRNNATTRNTRTRDEAKNSKDREKETETNKYNGKKITALQDFAGAKTDTDLSTRNTIENLISSLSTMGLGGSRALTRQILDAANMSNRKANATQATNNRDLDSAFNEYTVGNNDDQKKIQDQFGLKQGEAAEEWGRGRQNTLYKKADIYGAAGKTGERAAMMGEGDSLNSMIGNSAFLNPSYTGASRAMATPELGDYTQDIAKYDTSAIGAGAAGVTPVSAGMTNTPGNLAVRAIAVNDKDLGVKKKTEGSDLVFGV